MSKEDPIALYIVVRESIDMGRGKACAQSGHAVEKVMDLQRQLEIKNIVSHYEMHAPVPTPTEVEQLMIFSDWQMNGSRKITLIANEKEWETLKAEYGKDCNIVVDAGITDLVPGTETMMAFWPQYKSARSKSLKRLRSCE